jgi:hypothetical protein
MDETPKKVDEVDTKAGTRVKGMPSMLGFSLAAIIFIMIIVLAIFFL